MSVLHKVGGFLFYVNDFTDLIQRCISRGSLWEEGLIALVQELSVQSGRNGLFVNVGAHIGTVLIPCSKVFKKAVAFEPVQDTFAHLESNVRINSGGSSEIIVHPYALTSKCESAKIVFDPENTGGTHVITEEDEQANCRHAQFASSVVECKKFDDFFLGGTRVDFLVVDIEGSERAFLAGAEQTIRRDLPYLVIEIWTDAKRRFEKMRDTQMDVVNAVLSLGYTAHRALSADTFLFYDKR